MIPLQSPDDMESADDTPGLDHCTLLDEYWDALRREVGPDVRQRLIERDPTDNSIAEDLDFLNRLHQFRGVLLADDEPSQVSTTQFSEPSAMRARLRMRSTGAGASATGKEGQATVDKPRMIGKFLVLEMLDSGGQAQVYRVFHPDLGKDFALKLARRPVATKDQPASDAMLHEGRLLGTCEHPNLVQVFDVGVHEGRWFVVMEYVSGLTLRQFVEQRRPTPRQAARLVIELAQAVAYLHARGITHSDIKPQNVLIDDDGRPRLIDFGLARLKHAWRDGSDDAIGGTIAYMSPEQAEGRADRIGARTDVFGLGGLLYYLLTGRALYVGDTPESALRSARGRSRLGPRANPRVPHSLERICHKALEADPERRYSSAVELGRALKRFLERRWVAAAGLIVMALMAGALFVPRLLPPVAAKIVDLKVNAYRGDPPRPLGPIGWYPRTIEVSDRTWPAAQLDMPNYGYLIAMNPDGTVQLCAHLGESESPPLSAMIPAGKPVEFLFTDGPGLQVFAVVTSRKPLPAFKDWTGFHGLQQLWGHDAADDNYEVWSFEDGHYKLLNSALRGDLQQDPEPGPPERFQAVCEYLKKLHQVEAIQAIAFPVKPKK